MDKKIFILNGMAGSGKDTFADMVGEFVNTRHISIVDKPKIFAKAMGWNGDKNPKDREFLCNLKHLMDEYNDFNYAYVKNQVELFMQDPTLQFLFIDMREINQIKRACKDFNAYSVLVKRDNIEKITSNFADAQTLLNYEYDFVIDNNSSLSDLKQVAKQFANKLSDNDNSRFTTIYINKQILNRIKEALSYNEWQILIKDINEIFKKVG